MGAGESDQAQGPLQPAGFTGVFEIIAGIHLRRAITNEWLLIVIGVLSLLFGVLILFAPGALAIVLWIGAYALVFRIFLLALAFRMRDHRHQSCNQRSTLPPGVHFPQSAPARRRRYLSLR